MEEIILMCLTVLSPCRNEKDYTLFVLWFAGAFSHNALGLQLSAFIFSSMNLRGGISGCRAFSAGNTDWTFVKSIFIYIKC